MSLIEEVIVYCLECDQWYPLDSPKLQGDIARFGHTAGVYKKNMYVFGGFNGEVLNDLFVYKPGMLPNLCALLLVVHYKNVLFIFYQLKIV